MTGTERTPPEQSRNGPSTLLSQPLVGIGLTASLGMAILRVAMNRPAWIASWLVTATFLLYAGFLIVATYQYGPPLVRPRDRVLAALRIGLPVALLLVVFQSATPGYGLGFDRSVEVALVFGGLVTFGVLANDPRRYSPGQWLFVGCFAIVAGIFFYHGVDVGDVSARSRHPLWWGVLVGVNLLVIPQFVSTDRFLWTLNRLSVLLVALALPIYVFGEYSLFGLQFTFHRAYELPILGREVRATRSLFVNRNTFAEVVFVGVVAGTAELQRAVSRERPAPMVGVLGAFLAVNVLGLALAYDRAMWVITPLAVGIYVAYVGLGRRSVPVAVTAAVAVLLGGLLAVYLGILDTHSSNRFALWRAGVLAIADRPTLLGEGLVPPADVIADYHDLGTWSPHNSYVSIWIRTGILGGIAYATLVAGSVLWGAVRYRDVDVAALALAMGFAAHQLFEAYTLFQTGMGSVLATLAVGFLLFGTPEGRSSPSRESTASAEMATDHPGFEADFVGEEDDAPYRTEA